MAIKSANMTKCICMAQTHLPSKSQVAQLQHSHISHLGVKIIIEFNKVVVWWHLIFPNCLAAISLSRFFPFLHKVEILRFQLTFRFDLWEVWTWRGHSPSQFQPLVHVTLNYVFISFAVNRKLRHTHGSQVNKWRSFPVNHPTPPLLFHHPPLAAQN